MPVNRSGSRILRSGDAGWPKLPPRPHGRVLAPEERDYSGVWGILRDDAMVERIADILGSKYLGAAAMTYGTYFRESALKPLLRGEPRHRCVPALFAGAQRASGRGGNPTAPAFPRRGKRERGTSDFLAAGSSRLRGADVSGRASGTLRPGFRCRSGENGRRVPPPA
jgi:hypothetical protein